MRIVVPSDAPLCAGRDEMAPFLLDLRDPAALDARLTGSKAAALAKTAIAGLNTLPGVVLTTALSDAVDAGALVAEHSARCDQPTGTIEIDVAFC